MERREITVFDAEARASRFPVELPLRYRPIGEIGWIEAKTINVSRSGVLFEVDQLLPEETRIEMTFDLPVEMGGGSGAEVTCRGQIVRTILPPATDALPSVAVTITDYRSLAS